MTETTERTKRCTKCKRILAISEFYVNEVKPSGTIVFTGRCKPCTSRAVAQRRAERAGKVYETREEHHRSKGIAKANRLAELADRKSQDKLARIVALEHREKKWEMREWSKTVNRERERIICGAANESRSRWKTKLSSLTRTMKIRATAKDDEEVQRGQALTWGRAVATARIKLERKINRISRIRSNPWILFVETKARNLRRKSGGR